MDVAVPLTIDEIVDEIVRFAGIGREQTFYRVEREIDQLGWNVSRDLDKFAVTPHVYNSAMENLYKKGDGFIFETLVYWMQASRQRWSECALERIFAHGESIGKRVQDLDILLLGDGAGNDSLFLVKHGCLVDYFDFPGSKTFEFALKRFEYYGVAGKELNLVTDYEKLLNKKYDVIICFEVLEHLIEPASAIRDISLMLNKGGIALITEAFGAVDSSLPTHLKSNRRFDGKTPFLFMKYGMKLAWYNLSPKFRPMEFKKIDGENSGFMNLLQDFNILKEVFYGRRRHFKGIIREMNEKKKRK